MMIRHHAAMTTGMLGWEGLLYVVAPTPALMEASIVAAQSRAFPRVETLDAILARTG